MAEIEIVKGRSLVGIGVRDQDGNYRSPLEEGKILHGFKFATIITERADELTGGLDSLNERRRNSAIDVYEELQTAILEYAWLTGNNRVVNRILRGGKSFDRLPLAIKPVVTDEMFEKYI